MYYSVLGLGADRGKGYCLRGAARREPRRDGREGSTRRDTLDQQRPHDLLDTIGEHASVVATLENLRALELRLSDTRDSSADSVQSMRHRPTGRAALQTRHACNACPVKVWSKAELRTQPWIHALDVSRVSTALVARPQLPAGRHRVGTYSAPAVRSQVRRTHTSGQPAV